MKEIKNRIKKLLQYQEIYHYIDDKCRIKNFHIYEQKLDKECDKDYIDQLKEESICYELKGLQIYKLNLKIKNHYIELELLIGEEIKIIVYDMEVYK